MPFNVTGAKYAIKAISAAGTTNVTTATATFTSGDFGTTQRIVALYTSANVFKGIAWVRRFVSTTVLELENQFVDPVTGLFATQVVDDQVLVSKNLAESVVTGLTWDAVNRVATLTDGFNIGTSNVETSACIYDENATVAMRDAIQVTGGVVVFGKLVNYDGLTRESFVWNRDVWLNPLSTFNGAGAGSYNYTMLRPNGAGGHFFMFGGNIGGSYQSSNFMGIVGAGTGGKSFAFFGTRQNYGCTSPSNGTTWGANAARHLLYNCFFEATYGNANLIMWGDGTWVGGNITFPQYASGPLGAFRANGTSAYAAPSGKRALVADLGQGALIDGIVTSTYNFTNLITPAVNSVRTGSSGASTITANFNFQDDYTNLQANTTIVVRRTVDSVVATSVVNTATSTFTAKVLQASYTSTTTGNLTQTANYTSFDYTVKCYGFAPLSGNYSVVNYSLGTGGTGKNLTLGGLTNQAADSTVTLSLASALALSSKIAGNSATDIATISGSSTLDEQYDYLIAWGCSSAALAQYPSLSSYPISASGSTSVQLMQLYVQGGATLSAGTKLSNMSGTKHVEVTGTGSTATFSRGTITWSAATYQAQWFIQAGGTLTLTNSSLFTVNATAALGYDTKTMFGANTTLNLNNSTMVFNAPTGATSYGGSVFSAFQANGTATMNITNGTWTINGPTASSTYVIHTYWSASSAINGFTINGTAASAVALEMGATNQKLTGLSHAGQFNGANNGTNKQFYVHNDTLTYTGSTAPLNTSTARLVKWVWLDPVRSDGALFRWAVGNQGSTGANGAFGVLYFRPSITIDKIGYAPKMRLTPSALASRYPSKIVQTTALTTVALTNFYTDSGFGGSDGALPFVDSLDDKTVINPIDWTLNFRQPGWLDQSTTFTAATAKKGLVTYTASGSADTNYVNATTAVADSALITVDTTTKIISPVSGALAWSPQRLYNALRNWWATYASDTDFMSATGNGLLSLGDYSTSAGLSFIAGGLTDALSNVTTTGLINAASNGIGVIDSRGPAAIVRMQVVSATAVAAIWHPSTSATELFQTNNSGSTAAYQIYYPPGSVGLVKNYARELYGYQRSSGSITLAAGLNVVSFVDIPDVGIAQTTLATVQAYTTLENPDKFYDATAAFRLSEQGIKQGQMVTREGTSLNIGNFSHLINHNAAAVYSLTGSVITTKSSVYEPGSKYVKEIATPPATITAHTNEIITISIEDANGNSQATVAGTVNSLVDVWKITNATPVADFATGTKIASDIGDGAYRFIAVDGFKLVFNNKDNGVYRYCSMSKGDYTVGWYLYDSPTGGLTQEQGDVLSSISLKTTDTFNDVNSLMTGFVESTDSLHALRGAVDATPAATATAVWSAETRTLTSAGSSGATLAEIEASTVLAMAAGVAAVPAAVRTELATELARIDVAVSTRSTLTPEDIPEGLTAAQVRTELATELGRIDVAVSTRSTLTAEDVPEGLTAAEVWANPERTLTEAPGLTTGQAEQLRKVAQLHGVGVDLVVTETSRIAGDVSQTLTTDEAGSTTVSAA